MVHIHPLYTIALDGPLLVSPHPELLFIKSAPDSISINFENSSHLVNPASHDLIQFGVATLDAQEFGSASQPERHHPSLQFCQWTITISDHSCIQVLARSFGYTTEISFTGIVPEIKSCIPGARSTSRVSHQLACELHVLQHLHADLPKSVIAIIETVAITSQVCVPQFHWTLRHVPGKLQYAYDNLHSAESQGCTLYSALPTFY